MDFQDHDYTNTGNDKSSPMEFTYKMTSKEIEDFVKLRVSNNHLFSGKRNTSMWAWRAILRQMGLQQKMTHTQAKKKWENMKKKYKDLKNPPDGVKMFPEAWPYFSLMEDAIEGRLEGSAPVLKALPNGNFLPVCEPKRRKVSMAINSNMVSIAAGPEIEVSLNGDVGGEEEAVQAAGQKIECIMQDVDHAKSMMNSERQVMEREKKAMERERWALQRERAVLDREIAALDRDRASLERERAMMVRERAVVEKDRDAVSRDRLALERERTRLEKLSVAKHWTDEVTEDSRLAKDLNVVDRKERFLHLFEKLVEKF